MLIFLIALAPLLAQNSFNPAIPKTWDPAALEDWATPLAGLNARPGHFSATEYYRAPIDNLRSYPVYYPGREPVGYWEMLTKIGPKPLIERERLSTEADWIRIGRRVFEEHDVPAFRRFDAKLIAAARSAATYQKTKYEPRPDGTVPDLRWVPTARGVALSVLNCAACHERRMAGGTVLAGAPNNEDGSPLTGELALAGVAPFPLRGDSPGVMLWRAWAVPWIKDDIHDSLKSMTSEQLGPIVTPTFAPGIFPRWNGSPYYVTKIPDLIGLKDRKYIDHSATHRHRGPGDIMRYAALVTVAEAVVFGPHHMVTEEQRTVQPRLPDEALYALTLYLYSLQPPANPHPFDAKAAAGSKLFQREGCAGCHTPPLYTNNKLTLAQGFQPPTEHSQFLDIMRVSVATDPGLALKTRKGTGYYKVPSLKGVWYRGRYLHDGSLTTLAEVFNPARLSDGFVPSGFKGISDHRAIKGHEFGLKMTADEREQLIAFLKTI
jgi:mono/diheme cytochrome c family protein